MTPDSVFKETRWSRKYVPSGASRGCLARIERVGVGLAVRGCAAGRFDEIERAAVVGLGEVRCVGAAVTAGCVGAGANHRHAR